MIDLTEKDKLITTYSTDEDGITSLRILDENENQIGKIIVEASKLRPLLNAIHEVSRSKHPPTENANLKRARTVYNRTKNQAETEFFE